MKQIVYVGPATCGVEIETGQVVAHGATVEVGDELAERLLEQPENWQPAKSAKSSKEG